MESLYLHLIDVKLNIKDNVIKSLKNIGVKLHVIDVGFTIYSYLAIVFEICITVS